MNMVVDISPPGGEPDPIDPIEEATAEALLAFLPLHKRALGIAGGLVGGITLAGATAFAMIALNGDPSGLRLLGEYFYGYDVSWRGVGVGFMWGFLTSFVMAWFGAFVHNLAVATYIFVARTRDELAQTRDFLDHI